MLSVSLSLYRVTTSMQEINLRTSLRVITIDFFSNEEYTSTTRIVIV